MNKWFSRIYYGSEEGKSIYQKKWSFLTHVENVGALAFLILVIYVGFRENIDILKQLFSFIL